MLSFGCPAFVTAIHKSSSAASCESKVSIVYKLQNLSKKQKVIWVLFAYSFMNTINSEILLCVHVLFFAYYTVFFKSFWLIKKNSSWESFFANQTFMARAVFIAMCRKLNLRKKHIDAHCPNQNLNDCLTLIFETFQSQSENVFIVIWLVSVFVPHKQYVCIANVFSESGHSHNV